MGFFWIIIVIALLIIAIASIEYNKGKKEKNNQNTNSTGERFEENEIDEKLLVDFHNYLKSTDEFINSLEGVRLDDE